MGLTSLFSFVGCAKAQIGKPVFNLDNPDYNLNVAAKMSSLLDTTQQQIEVRYKIDTLKFYNTETDELFPLLMAYRNKGGSGRMEAAFRGFDFTDLSMVTTEQGTLVQVKGKRKTDEEDFAKLLKAATKKYGKPLWEEGSDFEGRPGQLYRWETKKEYIQLYAKSNSGKDTLIFTAAGNEKELGDMEIYKPRLDVTLWRWKKEYHNFLIFELDYCVLGEEAHKLSSLSNIQSAENYTPEWVVPFLITAHNLDALENSGEVWGKIEASSYYRIPNSKVIDETGITDSVEINREACLPCWKFEEFKSDFKDGLSTTAYMARQMEKGVKFTELMEDKELCPNITYYGEARWGKKVTESVIVTFHSNGDIGVVNKYLTEDEEQLPLVAGETRLRRTKRLSGIVEFKQNEKGDMVLRNPDAYEYDICDMCLIIDDNVKERLWGRWYDMEHKTAYMLGIQEELRKSGLDLEHTTARLVQMSYGTPLAFFTDGKQDMFMNIDKQGYSIYTPNNHEWKAGKVYRLYDYLISFGD